MEGFYLSRQKDRVYERTHTGRSEIGNLDSSVVIEPIGCLTPSSLGPWRRTQESSRENLRLVVRPSSGPTHLSSVRQRGRASRSTRLSSTLSGPCTHSAVPVDPVVQKSTDIQVGWRVTLVDSLGPFWGIRPRSVGCLRVLNSLVLFDNKSWWCKTSPNNTSLPSRLVVTS